MQLFRKIPAYYSLANVGIGPGDSYDLIGYIRTTNLIRQSYRVNGSLMIDYSELIIPSLTNLDVREVHLHTW